MNNGKKYTVIDKFSFIMTRWMGTSISLVVHTVIFLIAFGLIFLGVNADRVMLTLTTAVSLEAIYLALFIQMTVNRQEKKIRKVHDHVEDIAEDMEELAEGIEDLSNEDETTHNNRSTT